MTDTIRERIIKAYATAMAVVTVANGYQTGAGANVIRCRKNLDPSELPCIVIWPGIETSENRESGYQRINMKMGIEAHALFTDDASVISEKLLGDLIKAVFGQVVTSLVDEVQYESGGTDSYPDAGDEAVGAKISLNIKYNYLIGNPYSQ